MIAVSRLEKSFGERTLFRAAFFRLNAGERYGLVGGNGSGKTTLLNVLAGRAGERGVGVGAGRRAARGAAAGPVPAFGPSARRRGCARGNEELHGAMAERDALLAAPEEDFDAARFSAFEDIFARHDGYTAEAHAASILEGLGLPARVHVDPLSTLSGGFRLRVLLAQVLARAPNVLLLDEPTNHLDVDQVVLKAREGRRKGRGGGGRKRRGRGMSAWQRRRLEERAEELAPRVEAAEARVAEIDAVFADPAFYQGVVAGRDAVAGTGTRRARGRGRRADGGVGGGGGAVVGGGGRHDMYGRRYIL